MKCLNDNREAHDRCSACAEAFCDRCLVTVSGIKYCDSCKVLVLKDAPKFRRDYFIPDECKRAIGAGLLSCTIGLMCCSLIVGIAAAITGGKGLKIIQEDRNTLGGGACVATIIVGSAVALFGILSMIGNNL